MNEDNDTLTQATHDILENRTEAWEVYEGHPYDVVLKAFACLFEELEKRLKRVEGSMKKKPLVHWSLEVSPVLDRRIDEIAEESNSTKEKVLQRAMILIDVAMQEQEKGNHLAIVDKDGKILKDIVGLCDGD